MPRHRRRRFYGSNLPLHIREIFTRGRLHSLADKSLGRSVAARFFGSRVPEAIRKRYRNDFVAMVKRKRAMRKSRRVARRVRRASVIPTIEINPTFSKWFRYSCTSFESKGADPITTLSLLNLLTAGVDATHCRRLFSAVRLRRLRVFGVPSASAYQPVRIEWAGDRNPNRVIESVGSNVNPAMLDLSPPAGSFASMWINAGNSAQAEPDISDVVSISAPVGSLVDVLIDFQLADYDSAEDDVYELVVFGGSTPTVGLLFYNALDNTASPSSAASGVIQPLGPSSVTYCYG